MTKRVHKTTTVVLNGKEYSVDERLPKQFLKRDFQGIPYIDISVVRDILRQMGVLKKISFGPVQKVAEGQNSITYTQKAIIELKDGTILEGDGYMNISTKKLLSGAAFGVLSNLKSRAVKTALVYYKKIFELPIEDEEEVYEQVAEEAEKKGKTDAPKKVIKEDYIEKFITFISENNPKTLEEYQKLKKEFINNNLAELKKMEVKEKDKLKQLMKEYEESFKSSE